ncbi:MAG: hypothetical protein ACOZAM_17950 [Pseudomonadota bacterium]
MSDDYHRPTYTSANAENEPTNKDGLYNPTQVRLYGIPGKAASLLAGPKASISAFEGAAQIRLDLSDKAQAQKNIDHVIKVLQALRDKPTQQTLLAEARFAGGSEGKSYQLGLITNQLGTVFLDTLDFDGKANSKLSAGVMFGYAYEGHTYDFAKPKLMLVPSQPLKGRIPKDDSGYADKYDEGYRVWLVDKLDQCIEVEVNQGFVDEIVLEANTPGKRSPTAYRAAMTLSHRGGRLSE